ncbi:hypothetical protein [uncultured Ruminococcus sp.]|uniref:hypothetical protein n=1 Tax=uncultured Ruminococcus sp. TaxID=165186 RepID=UPI0025DCE4BA|nr:hypothetical protein [uncultured Ruminococcus sp.]
MMTNREKYITKRNEYDLMITIYEAKNFWCPIQIVGGKKPKCLRRRNASGYPYSDCRNCIQEWLNEEVIE